jgi:transcriptional regulator with XRE-family HTH domain
VELVTPLEKSSPLAAARLHRQLTVEEAARRANLTPDEVEWLEDGRVYRFPSTDAALLAAVLYATSLGIDHREARILAGLRVAPRPVETVSRGRRLIVFAAAAGAIAALVASLIVIPETGREQTTTAAAPIVPAAQLPPAWKVDVDVLNGCGDINYTRQVASHIQALAYRIGRVRRAPRFGQKHTVIYFEPGGEGVATRLAQQLGVTTAPLPGGSNPNRLVAIVGCANVAGN